MISTILVKPGENGENDQLSAVTLCNHPEASGFTILPLPVSDPLEENVTYCIETTFSDVWPLIEKSDPKFGNITITAPVNTNHLAIGYGKFYVNIVNISMNNLILFVLQIPEPYALYHCL